MSTGQSGNYKFDHTVAAKEQIQSAAAVAAQAGKLQDFDPPPKSAIKERIQPESRVLYWWTPLSIGFQVVRAVLVAWYLAFEILFLMGFWLFLTIAPDPQVHAWLLVAYIAGWCLGTGISTWCLWGVVRPIRPESITLGPTSFSYDPGSLPGLIFRMGFFIFFFCDGRYPSFSSVFARCRTVVVPISGIAFSLNRESEDHSRLLFDGSEIGRSLTSVDKAWLFDNLEAWRLAVSSGSASGSQSFSAPIT